MHRFLILQLGDDVHLRFTFHTHRTTLRGGSGLMGQKQEVTGNTETGLENLRRPPVYVRLALYILHKSHAT